MAVYYTPEIAAKICERLAAGESLTAICKSDDMPCESAVRAWALDNMHGFAAEYARARSIGYLRLGDETLQIADTTKEGVVETDKLDKFGKPYTEVQRRDMIEHRRLQVDTRKWMLSKMLPKVFGDKIAVEHSGSVSIVDRLRAGRKRVSGE